MSEKRFELVEAIYNEIDKQQIEIMDNLEKQIVEKQKVVDLLNSLQEENGRLKKEVENLQTNMMESLRKHRNYEKSLEEENKRKTNEIKLLRKQYSKIPKNIREVWK